MDELHLSRTRFLEDTLYTEAFNDGKDLDIDRICTQSIATSAVIHGLALFKSQLLNFSALDRCWHTGAAKLLEDPEEVSQGTC